MRSPSSSSSSSSSTSGDDEPADLFDTALLFKDENVVTTVQRIAKHTGVPRGQIYPVKGYTSETVRNRLLETTALRALAEAVELAIEGYDERERQEALSSQGRRNKATPATPGSGPSAADDDDAAAFGREGHFGSGGGNGLRRR